MKIFFILADVHLRHEGGQDHGERQERDGAEDLGEAHQEHIDLAAEIAGDTADDDADDRGDDNGDRTDGHRHLTALNDTQGNVRAVVIRAEEIALQAPLAHELVVGIDCVALERAAEDVGRALCVVGDLALAKVFIAAPGEHTALARQRGVVVGAADNLNDLLALMQLGHRLAARIEVTDEADGAVIGQGADRLARGIDARDLAAVQELTQGNRGGAMLSRI